MDLTNTYLGFTDNMNPMQKARAEKLLDGKKRYNGTVLTNKQFALNQIMEGCIPEFKDDITHWSNKIHNYTQPKTEYYLKTKDNSYWTIEKTLYNFAVYLIAKEFNNELITAVFIKDEQARKETERIEKEKQELAEVQAKKDQEQAKIEYKNWLVEQIKNYNNSEQLELLKEIFLAEIGSFGDNQIKLLVLIDNIDNSMCRKQLKDWLHSGNTTSKKAFYHITGIKLPSTNKGTYEILDNIQKSYYKGIVTYKKRQTHDKNMDTFYRLMVLPDIHFQEVEAEVFNKYGLEMFITEYSEEYQINDARSGLKIVDGITKKEAMDKLKKLIDKHGVEGFNKQIGTAIERYGLSPKYNQEIAV